MENLVGKIIEISITDLNSQGQGVGRFQGWTTFVNDALPNEKVEVTILSQHKRFLVAQLKTIIEPSSKRRESPCSFFEKCGGCQLLHLEYSSQIELKQQRVVESLSRIAKITAQDLVQPCISSPQEFNYRNKVQFTAQGTPDSLQLGFFERGTHTVVEVQECLVHTQIGNQIYKVLSRLLKSTNVCPYDEKKHRGSLRHLLLRTAVHTNEIMVIFVALKDEREKFTSIAKALQQECPEINSIVLNINRKKGNTILGSQFFTLAGKEWIEETFMNLSFCLSPGSFFQVNTPQAQVLYETAFELAELKGSERCLDVYCGIGSLTLPLAKRVKSVVGIESFAPAVKDAERNRLHNKIDNVQFHCMDAQEMQEDFFPVDVVFLDPPRKGCSEQVLERIASHRPAKLIYISCNPATFARDALLLQQRGYTLSTVQPLDMFPQTQHVETVALFLANGNSHSKL